MRKRLLNRVNQVLALCLSALGLAGCITEKYGCPNAGFVAMGSVQSEERQPIEGVKVVVKKQANTPVDMAYISTYTHTDGTYRTEHATISPTESMWIHAIDTTGTYAEDSAQVKVDYITKGDGHWYKGEAEAKADFILRKKEQQ